MANDPSRAELIAQLRRWINDGEKNLSPYRRALKAALAEGEDSPPWTSRFCNIPTIAAVLRFLNDEKHQGARGEEIYDALMEGGCGVNSPNFERDLKNSLIRASKSGVLVKHGDKYLPGKKPPAHSVNRHGRKPLK